MNDAVISHRSDDAVISVQQNNIQRSVVISGVNDQALKLLGADKEDAVLKTPLNSLLGAKTKETINNYLEYTDNGTDLADVVSKMRDFVLLDKQAREISVKPKIFRTTSQKDFLNYTILIRDTSVTQKLDAFRREKLPPGSKYALDASWGVLDESSTKVEISIVLDFVRRTSLNAVLSMVALDKQELDNNRKNEALKVLVDTLSANVRYTDILGHLGDNKFIVVLLGCDGDNAHSAVTRVHGKVSEKLAQLSPPETVSFAYSEARNTVYSKLLVNLQQTLLAVQRSGGGAAKLAQPSM